MPVSGGPVGAETSNDPPPGGNVGEGEGDSQEAQEARIEAARTTEATALLGLPLAQFKAEVKKADPAIVRRALDRAGIESIHRGAHVLRHSAATAMLRNGASLAGVGAVLRHRSPSTTALYAKVDIGLLSEIAQPWGGRLPC